MGLITSILEFKKQVSVSGNMKFASLEPYVKEAEQLYLLPLLGQAFYDEFLPLYEASVAPVPTALNAENAALLPYIQKCLGYYTLLKAIPNLTASFGELGIRYTRSEDSDTAPRWKEEKMLLNALVNGDLHADKLLEFLETHEADYPTWKASSANTRVSGLIVYSTKVAQQHIDINSSRRVFLQLLPTIKKLEETFVPKLVGAAQYAELLSQIKTDFISSYNVELMAMLAPIIAKRALYMRLPFMQVGIGADGIRVYSEVTEIRSKDYLASREQIKELRAALMDEFSTGYMADEQALRQFILDYADNYPLIKASAVYTVQPDPGPTWQPLNDPNNKFFAV